MNGLSDRQLATVLACLRYWQNTTEEMERGVLMGDHFHDFEPLSDSEIDQLCNQINTTPLRLEVHHVRGQD